MTREVTCAVTDAKGRTHLVPVGRAVFTDDGVLVHVDIIFDALPVTGRATLTFTLAEMVALAEKEGLK